MIGDYLRLPFSTDILGVEVMVEKVDLTDAEEIVAICRKGTTRQRISILELPLSWPLTTVTSPVAARRRGKREDPRPLHCILDSSLATAPIQVTFSHAFGRF